MFGVWGWFGVWGSGLKVEGLGFGSGPEVYP